MILRKTCTTKNLAKRNRAWQNRAQQRFVVKIVRIVHDFGSDFEPRVKPPSSRNWFENPFQNMAEESSDFKFISLFFYVNINPSTSRKFKYYLGGNGEITRRQCCLPDKILQNKCSSNQHLSQTYRFDRLGQRCSLRQGEVYQEVMFKVIYLSSSLARKSYILT